MKIAIIDDNPTDLAHFARALSQLDEADVLALESLHDKVSEIKEHGVELIVLDDYLSAALTAEDSLKTIGAHFPNVPVIVITGVSAPSRRSELIRLGAFDCMIKDDIDESAIALIAQMAASKHDVFRRPSKPN